MTVKIVYNYNMKYSFIKYNFLLVFKLRDTSLGSFIQFSHIIRALNRIFKVFEHLKSTYLGHHLFVTHVNVPNFRHVHKKKKMLWVNIFLYWLIVSTEHIKIIFKRHGKCMMLDILRR